jgi:undecaprenyl diphosphate synthase
MATKNDHPLHLAIIPDGNRRWAKKQMLQPWKGHEVAMKHFGDLLEYCYNDPRIALLTIWGFSTENWKRDSKEVDMLMNLFLQYLQDERSKFTEKNMRLLHSGRRDRLPRDLMNLIEEIEEETKENTTFTFHLALDYGGKDEVLRAINKSKLKIQSSKLTNELLSTHLDQPSLPDIDLVIRTSNEQRTSNFFLWQSTYAEWMFEPKLFPDFGMDDLEKCLENYEKRMRRFGS